MAQSTPTPAEQVQRLVAEALYEVSKAITDEVSPNENDSLRTAVEHMTQLKIASALSSVSRKIAEGRIL